MQWMTTLEWPDVEHYVNRLYNLSEVRNRLHEANRPNNQRVIALIGCKQKHAASASRGFYATTRLSFICDITWRRPTSDFVHLQLSSTVTKCENHIGQHWTTLWVDCESAGHKNDGPKMPSATWNSEIHVLQVGPSISCAAFSCPSFSAPTTLWATIKRLTTTESQ